MTDGQAFLLVLVLIYLSDCLVWLPPSGYAAISFWSRRFFLRRPAVSFDALRKGFAVLNPLPPFGTVFVSSTWPVSITPDGLAPLSRENPNPGSAIGALPGSRYESWEDVKRLGYHGSYLTVNGKHFAGCASNEAARRLAAELKKIQALAPESRKEEISRLVERGFREKDVSRRARFFRRATGSLRLSATILFFFFFFAVPFAYWKFQDGPRFFLILGAAWILMVQIGIEFFRLHRRFYPALRADRWQHLIFSLIFPHYAIRSLDVLSKGFLAGYHPCAIATALADSEELGEVTQRFRRDAQHPIPLSENGPASSASLQFHEYFLKPGILRLLSQLDTPATANSSAEEDTPAGGTAECPRCGTSYESAGIPCPDCGGIETVSNRP